MVQTILTGIQPSGQLHLGNYFGAVRPLLQWQEETTCFFCIVDLHALTVSRDPAALRRVVQEQANFYLAAGVDPQRVTLFLQSSVPAHSEAAWLLQCVTPMGELQRMTQFKEKRGTEQSVLLGLYTYPVLQAADILLYQADGVPIGEDQLQHLELTRFLVERFHHRYGEGVFTSPKSLLASAGARLMALDDPTRKMSKSGNPIGCIYVGDSEAAIVKKLKKAVTDTEGSVRYDPHAKPGMSNLLMIYHLVSGLSIQALEDRYQGKGYGIFKQELSEHIWAHLEPLQKRYQALAASDQGLQCLREGGERARGVAQKTLQRMQERMGVGGL